VSAKDLGDILVEKGLITPEELREAREEEKLKEETSRRECPEASSVAAHHGPTST
jgi:hypothetical protein